MKRLGLFLLLLGCVGTVHSAPIDLKNRRELFVDSFLIDRLQGAEVMLHEPQDRGPVLFFDQPWEGKFSGFVTLLQDGRLLRAYYRGKPDVTADGRQESLCVAESLDGIHWTKPKLGLVEFQGSKQNNVLLREDSVCHNFSPFIDRRPDCPPEARYKALGGVSNIVEGKGHPTPMPEAGLIGYRSSDGLHWKPMQEGKVLISMAQVRSHAPPHFNAFDSQNVSFWSEHEQVYVCYFRVHLHEPLPKGNRSFMRATSKDFLHWDNFEMMQYPIQEQMYTNQTHSYYRAPHLYVSLGARFLPGRRPSKLQNSKAEEGYKNDLSDIVFMSSRGGNRFESPFTEAFLKPGFGAENWSSRTNYPALNVVHTGDSEMSLYVNQNYAQPSAHLRRYAMRIDGFSSIRSKSKEGTFTTKAFQFEGKALHVNYATSAAGSVEVELQDEKGVPLEGFTFADAIPLVGNEIDETVRWQGGDDLSKFADKPVRLVFKLKDADLYSLKFE